MEQKEQKKKVEEQKLDQVNGGIGIPEWATSYPIVDKGGKYFHITPSLCFNHRVPTKCLTRFKTKNYGTRQETKVRIGRGTT